MGKFKPQGKHPCPTGTPQTIAGRKKNLSNRPLRTGRERGCPWASRACTIAATIAACATLHGKIRHFLQAKYKAWNISLNHVSHAKIPVEPASYEPFMVFENNRSGERAMPNHRRSMLLHCSQTEEQWVEFGVSGNAVSLIIG